MNKKIGIALSGGGARGIAHLGIIKALEEFGVKPSVISGTSAGALAGAFYAGGYSMEEMMLIIKKGDFFNFSHILFKKQGLFSMKSFEEIILQYFPSNSFEDLSIPLHVTATDVLKGELVYFSSGNLSKSLMASSAIPFVFQPVSYNDSLYVDGGVLNIFPVEPLINKCDIIIGSYVNAIEKEVTEIHLKNIVDRCFHLALSNSVHNKIEKCTLYIEPPKMTQFGLFDFKKAPDIFTYGYDYCLTLEKKIKDCLSS